MSDPLEELKRISAAEKASARDEAAEEARKASAAREKERRKAEARALAGQRAPGFFSSMRFFSLMMVGLIFGTIVGSAWLEGDTWWRSPVVAGLAALWLVVLLVLWLDAATWRRRLPFEVIGFDTINGKDVTGDGEVPYIAFELHVRFIGVSDESARDKTLEILGDRINRELQKDDELDLNGQRVWRVLSGGRLSGEGTRMLYTQRLIEKWLRREVRLLHRAFPVGAVTVHATYTGKSFRTSSSD